MSCKCCSCIEVRDYRKPRKSPRTLSVADIKPHISLVALAPRYYPWHQDTTTYAVIINTHSCLYYRDLIKTFRLDVSRTDLLREMEQDYNMTIHFARVSKFKICAFICSRQRRQYGQWIWSRLWPIYCIESTNPEIWSRLFQHEVRLVFTILYWLRYWYCKYFLYMCLYQNIWCCTSIQIKITSLKSKNSVAMGKALRPLLRQKSHW